MRIVCDAKKMLQAARLTDLAMSSKTTNDVLRNIKLTANRHLNLSGTDTQVAVDATVEGAEVKKPGAALIRGETLLGILGKMDGDVEIYASDQEVYVADGRGEYTLPVIDPKLFPALGTVQGEPNCKIMAGVLDDLFRKVGHAVCRTSQGVNYSVTGVGCQVEAGMLRLMGHGGTKLAMAQGQAPFQKSMDFLPCVPPRALKIVSAMAAEDKQQDISFWFTMANLYAQCKNGQVYARLLEGKFPDVPKVIRALAKGAPTTFHIEAGVLRKAVDRASIISDVESQRIEFNLVADAQEAIICGVGHGNSSVELSDDISIDGQDVKFAINGSILLSVLNALDDEILISVEVYPEYILVRWGDDFTAMVSLMGLRASDKKEKE